MRLPVKDSLPAQPRRVVYFEKVGSEGGTGVKTSSLSRDMGMIFIMIGPSTALLHVAHNDASDSASKAKTETNSLEEVSLFEVVLQLGKDKRHKETYPKALEQAKTNDVKMDNLPGATRQSRTINVAYLVQTLTPNLAPRLKTSLKDGRGGSAKDYSLTSTLKFSFIQGMPSAHRPGETGIADRHHDGRGHACVIGKHEEI